MTNPTIRIHDQETDQVIEREMTANELAFINETTVEFENQQNAKAAAEAKLLAIGLTLEDLAALGLANNQSAPTLVENE